MNGLQSRQRASNYLKGRLLCLYPSHLVSEFLTYLFDKEALFLGAEGFETGPAYLVLQYPFLSKLSILYLLENLLHLHRRTLSHDFILL